MENKILNTKISAILAFTIIIAVSLFLIIEIFIWGKISTIESEEIQNYYFIKKQTSKLSLEEEIKMLEKQLEGFNSENQWKEMESFVPYKTEVVSIEYYPYGGIVRKEEDLESYYKYKDNEFKITPVQISQGKHDYTTYFNLLILNSEKNIYEPILQDLTVNTVYGYKDYLVVKDNTFVYIFSFKEKIKKKYFADNEPKFFMMDDELYSEVHSDLYFYDSRSGAGVNRYYYFDNGKFIEKREMFKNNYLAEALESAKYLKEIKWENFEQDISNDIYDVDLGNPNLWLNSLLNKTVNYILAGEEKAWNTFDKGYEEFQKKYPLMQTRKGLNFSKINPNDIKDDIKKETREQLGAFTNEAEWLPQTE